MFELQHRSEKKVVEEGKRDVHPMGEKTSAGMKYTKRDGKILKMLRGALKGRREPAEVAHDRHRGS